MQESSTPFTDGEKRSTSRICTEKQTAHRITNRSPAAIVKSSWMLSR